MLATQNVPAAIRGEALKLRARTHEARGDREAAIADLDRAVLQVPHDARAFNELGISEAQTTNLAIVAPGIAEALLATAIGLVAAIPAVVIYNFLARAITGYRQNLADASAAIERLASRDLDVRRAVRLPAAQRGERAGASLVKLG